MAPKHDFSFWKGLNDYHKGYERWKGTTPDLPLHAIDAWTYGKTGRFKEAPKHTGPRLHEYQDEEVQEWLQNPLQPDTSYAGDVDQPTGHIRVLVCHVVAHETKRGHPEFKMSRETVKAAESCLNLPAHTFHNMSSMWGIESGEFEVETNGKEELKYVSLDITIKTPVVTTELPHSALALSYRFDTATTTAFVRGLNGVVKDVVQEGNATLSDRLKGDLERLPHLWRHPLLLPSILLRHQLVNIRELAREKLQFGTDDIQSKLQIKSYDEIAELLGGMNDDQEAKDKRVKFVGEVSNMYRTAIHVRRHLQSAQRTATFLLGLLEEVDTVRNEITKSQKQPLLDVMNRNESRCIKDIIKSIDSTFAGFEYGVDAIISTLDVQLNVLSTVASQLDNVRSVRIATEAGLDSIAMKILAFVTTLFLPATFVATLFSMSMFDWQANGDPETPLLSRYFWIFWAVSVPLTIVVLVAWWVWFNVMRLFYIKRFADAGNGAAVTKTGAFVEWIQKYIPWIKGFKWQDAAALTGDAAETSQTYQNGNEARHKIAAIKRDGQSDNEKHVTVPVPRSRTGRVEAGLGDTQLIDSDSDHTGFR